MIDVGLERYARVSAQAGIETRHPYVDQRLVEFLLAVPIERVADGHWPKGIVRAAMRGYLTEEVRLRKGKQHLGWTFFLACLRMYETRFRQIVAEETSLISCYTDIGKLQQLYLRYSSRADDETAQLWYVLTLVDWLQQVYSV